MTGQSKKILGPIVVVALIVPILIGVILSPIVAIRLQVHRGSSISSDEKNRFGAWLERSLVTTHLVDRVVIDKFPTRGELAFVIVNSSSWYPIPRLDFNAAYVPSAGVVLVDDSLIKMAFTDASTDVMPRTPSLDPDVGFINQQLLMFIILHEVGHYRLDHKGRHFFDALRTGNDKGSASLRHAEAAADSFALTAFRSSMAGGESLSWDEVWDQLSFLIGFGLFETLSSHSGVPLVTSSVTHPSIVTRCQSLIEMVSTKRPLSPEVEVQARTYAKLLRGYDSQANSEVIAPHGTRFLHAVKRGCEILFMLDDGRVGHICDGDCRRERVTPLLLGGERRDELRGLLGPAAIFMWQDSLLCCPMTHPRCSVRVWDPIGAGLFQRATPRSRRLLVERSGSFQQGHLLPHTFMRI